MQPPLPLKEREEVEIYVQDIGCHLVPTGNSPHFIEDTPEVAILAAVSDLTWRPTGISPLELVDVLEHEDLI